MNTPLKTTKEALEILGCARSTLTQHKEKLGIEPATKGNANFYTDDQIEQIKQSLESVPIRQPNNKQPSTTSQSSVNQYADSQSTDSQPEVNQQSVSQTELSSHLRQEIETLKQESKEALERAKQEAKEEREKSTEKIEELLLQVGQWQGTAQAFERQNQLLIANQKPEENQPETAKEDDIIDAEMIPEEEQTEDSEKNPTKISEDEKPKTLWQKFSKLMVG